MTAEFLRQCIPLWDGFECQLKQRYIQWLASGYLAKNNDLYLGVQTLYEHLAFEYWSTYRQEPGSAWMRQIEEYYFESKYYSFKRLFSYFDHLDLQLKDNLKAMPERIREILQTPHSYLWKRGAEECYQLTLKPLLAQRKQEILNQLQQLEAELLLPVSCQFSLPLDETSQSFHLEFQTRKHPERQIGTDLSGFTYTYNGRRYTDVTSLWAEETERLSPDAALGRDVYGEGVLKTYHAVPTFDYSDRLWDSRVLKYLMFDGKDIHLVIMRGGSKISGLTFYDQLLSASIGLKPYAEKLGWPIEGISWKVNDNV